MAEKLQNAVKALLRSSEDVTIALQVHLVPENRTAWGEDDQERVLAVVKHRNQEKSVDEGSVFVLRYKSDDSLEINRAYPIIGLFVLSTAQSPRSHVHNAVLDRGQVPAPSEFTLTIQPGQSGVRPITLTTRDVTRLRIFLAQCKRLKELAPPSTSAYSWLVTYTAKRTPSSLLCSTPSPDLRVVTQPLHTRLSTPEAGTPVDDLGNIAVVREEWVRARADEEMKAMLGGKIDVRIRVGTFNVNGKTPSQDLAAWVSGSTHPTPDKTNPDLPLRPSFQHRSERDELNAVGMALLPPLRRLSSFSIDEVHSNGSVADASTNLGPPPIDDPTPDIIVLGFQELDLSAEALLYSTSTVREDAWCAAVFAGLGETRENYVKLASKQLVGMLLLVIVKKSVRPYCGEIKMAAAGAGIMGMMGNKGGTALRLTLTPPLSSSSSPTSHSNTPPNSDLQPSAQARPITLTFVNAHLAAFDEMADKRNADFHDLGRRLRFDTESGYSSWYANVDGDETGSGDGTGEMPVPTGIYESDVLVWMGDLNYRVDLHDADVRALLASPVKGAEVETLLEYDQLKNAQRDKKAFQGYLEHPIRHLPSYRFGAGVIDNMGYDTKRKPAWTDRILHMHAPSTHVRQLSYTSYPEISMSDHRPVAASFCLELDVVDARAYDDTVHNLYHSAADFEETEPAHLHLESNEVNFGSISYKQAITRSIIVENRAKVPSVFHFIPLGDGTLHPDWLSIAPMAGLLLANERAVLKFTVDVHNDVASRLNMVSRHLEATIVLHTALGSDAFISITAEYQYTCFATPLSQLVRTSGPIRTQDSPTDRPTVNAPREFMRLVNWMMTNAVHVDGLFVESADDSVVAEIRECLDTGTELPKGGEPVALAAAQTLLQLLDSLPEPLIPVSLHAQCAQAKDRDEAFEILDGLPNEVINLWISVTAFLHFFAQQPSTDQAEAGTSKTEVLVA